MDPLRVQVHLGYRSKARSNGRWEVGHQHDDWRSHPEQEGDQGHRGDEDVDLDEHFQKVGVGDGDGGVSVPETGETWTIQGAGASREQGQGRVQVGKST